MKKLNKSSKFQNTPVAVACFVAVVGLTPVVAQSESASYGIDYPYNATPTIGLTQFKLGSGLYGLAADMTAITGLTAYDIALQSLQRVYASGSAIAIQASVLASSGGQVILSGGGTTAANVSSNSIFAGATGNANTLSLSGGASVDMGLLSTNKSIGALAMQFLGSQQTSGGVEYKVNSSVSGDTIGAYYTGMDPATLAVNNNSIGASSTLNQSTTLVSGAVPLGFSESTGGSSTISFDPIGSLGAASDHGSVSGSTTASININTTQGTLNGGISAGTSGGSSASLTNDLIALKSQQTGDTSENFNLTAPLSLNGNTESASFTGNAATNVFRSQSVAGSTTNAFAGSVAVTNAQANAETLNYSSAAAAMPTANVSGSKIIADLTYRGVDVGSGSSNTQLTSSLSVSGTAGTPQAISAQSIGNSAGIMNSAGQITASGNAIEFTNSTVNITGTNSPTGASVTLGANSGSQSASGDFVINNAQFNQRPNASGSGVESLVTGSSVTAAVDQLAASGTVAVNYNAATAGATGNLAGNLINAQGNNVNGSMAVVSNQLNSNAAVTAQNTSSTIGAGIGMSIDSAYTVSDRSGMTAVSGSVTVDHNAIGAVAQGNLAANNLLETATNLTAQVVDGGEGAVSNSVSSNGASSNAGLAAVNVQNNIDSSAWASVSGGKVQAAFVDQAGDYQGNLAALGAATVSLSSSTISALSQGNNGGANIGVTGGTDLSLTAAAANSQGNDWQSNISAYARDSSILATALTTAGSTITANSNAVLSNANGNLAANGISVAGGTTIDGAASATTLDLQSLQGNAGSIIAITTGTAVGVRVGATSANTSTPSSSPSNAGHANSNGEVFSSSTSVSTGALAPFFTGNDITTIDASTMAVNASRVGASASGNSVDNNVLLSGTNLGGTLPVGARIGTTQNNAYDVSGHVIGTDIGVQLQNQSNSVSNSGTYSSTAATSNVYHYTVDSGSGSVVDHYVAENLSTAAAAASSTVTLTEAGGIKGINNSTLSVSGSQVTASGEGNAATNALQVNGTAVTLLGSASALNIANTQLNSSAGSIDSYLDSANIGVKVSDVSGSSTAALSNRATATVAPNSTVTGSGVTDESLGTGIYSGSGSAIATSSAAGAFSATGIDTLTAKVDASRLSASSTGNAADNRLTVGATALTSTSMPNVVINNSQSNGASVHAVDGGEGSINLGVMLGVVSATQTATANGAGANSTVTSTNNPGDTSVYPSNAYLNSTATFGASGGAVANGISAGSSSVQGNSVLATATGNTVGNTINLGSTAASALSAKIDNASAEPGQYNNGSINSEVASVTLGNYVAGTTASNTSTATPQAFGTATASDTTYATASGAATASGTASSTASATGLIGAHTTTSANTLQATGYGNQASNLISGNGTTLNAVSGQPAASVANQQINDTGASMTANVGLVVLGDIVGEVLASGSATAGTGSGTSRIIGSGSSTASTTLAANVTQFASAAFTANASGSAIATQTATGISALTSAVEGNTLQAGNYGNKASNAITLASTTLAGSSGTATLANVSAQNNAGSLSASVSNVGLGVLLASTTASGGATASVLADATATSNSAFVTPGGGGAQRDESVVSSTTSATGWAYASGSSSATGITGSTAGVNANLLGAANYANSASNSIALTGTTVSGVSGQTTASGSNTQTNSASLGASVSGVSVGVTAGAVNADFSASADATASAASPRNATIGADTSITATQSFTVTFAATHQVETYSGSGIYVTQNDAATNQYYAGIASYSGYTPNVSCGSTCTVTFTANSTTTPIFSTSNFAGSTSVSGVTGNYPGGSAYAYNGNTWVSPATQAAGYGSSSSSATANAYATATAIGITGSTLKVQSNQLSAINFANSADNTATLTGTVLGTAASPVTVVQTNNQTNTGSGSATASNIQLGVVLGAVTANANATANASASVGSGSGWSESTNSQADSYAYGIVGSNITVGGTASAPQKVLAESVGNSATNTITATNTTGTGASGSSTLLVSNNQLNSAGGALSATVGGVTVGVKLGDVSATSYADANSGGWSEFATAVGVSGSTVAVQSNQLTALTYANSANNSITATTSNTLAGSAAGTPTFKVDNTSQANNGATSSTVASADVGVVLGGWVQTSAYDSETATSIASSTLNVSSNGLTAASYGNGASNIIGVAAQSSGSAALPLSSTVSSTQNNSGSQTALMDQTRVGVFTSETWTGDGTSTGITGSAVTVGSNRLDALTYGNSAANANSVSAANTGYLGSLVTGNTQINVATASGSSTISNTAVGLKTDWVVGYDALGMSSTPTTVQSNALSASSYGNYATNASSASGGNALYSGNSVTGVNVQANNTQDNYAAMNAAVNSSTIGAQMGSVKGPYVTGVADSALTVNSNSVKALGVGNYGNSTVALSDAIGAVTGAVDSSQTNNGTVTATVGSTSSPGVGPSVMIGFSTGEFRGSGGSSAYTALGISGGEVAVQSNRLSALSYANSSDNSLTSTSSNTLAGTNTYSGGHTFIVGSDQTNTAATRSNLGYVDVGTVLGQGSGTVARADDVMVISASPQNVSSNVLTAGSYGNGSNNAIGVVAQSAGAAATPLSTRTDNWQENAGAQTALIVETRVGVATTMREFGGTTYSSGSGTSIDGSALTVNSNKLDAVTYGNSAANSTSVTVANNAYLGNLATDNHQINGALAFGPSSLDRVYVGVLTSNVYDGASGGSATGLNNSPATVQSNTLSALSYGNDATNATSASGGNALYAGVSGGNLQTNNSQVNLAAMESTATSTDYNFSSIGLGVMVGPEVGATASGVVGSALTVNSNAVKTLSVGNSAANSVALSNAIGEVTGAVNNWQYNSGGMTATLGDTQGNSPVYVGVMVGSQVGSTSAVAISASPVAVQSNQLSALTYANSASNGLTSTSSNTLAGTAIESNTFMVGSSQTNDAGGAGRSTVADVYLGTLVGSVTGATATGITASAQNISSNSLKAGSYGNGADNTLSVTAQLPGTSGAPLSTLVSGEQTNSGAQTALMTNANVGVFTNTIAGSSSATGITGSSLTVNSNTLDAATYGNSAVNANSVKAGNDGYLGALATTNTQNNYASGSGSSSIVDTTVGVSLGDSAAGTSIATSPTNVSSNQLTALSYANSATNSTSASGGNVMYGSAAATELQTTNTQNNYASTTAAGTRVSVGVFTGLSGTGVDGLAATVNNNLLAAQANGNVAGNSNTLSGQQLGSLTLPLSTDVSSTQANSGGQSATLDTSRLGVFVGGTGAVYTGVETSTLAVSGNGLKAVSYANSATNNNSATASNNAYLGAVSASNTQTNTAAGTGASVITGATVGVNLDYSVTAVNASALSVNANALTSASYGNGADNSVSVNAQLVGSSDLSAATTASNSQSNAGAMSALVGSAGSAWATGTRVGVFTDTADQTGLSGSTVAVDANLLRAMTYGNNANNTNSLSASNTANLSTALTSNSQTNTSTGSGSSTINYTTVGLSLADVGATTSGAATGLSASPTSVSSNQLLAMSYGNSASNATSASGGNALYGALQTTSDQTNDASMTSSAIHVNVGVELTSVGGDPTGTSNTTGTGITGSALTVDSNVLKTLSVGNSASNTVALSDGIGGATGALSNTQHNTGALSASVGGAGGAEGPGTNIKMGVIIAGDGSALTVTGTTGTAVGISGGAVSVQSNQIAALSYANSAANTLTSSSASTLTGTAINVDTFSNSNHQGNTASTSSSVRNVDLGTFLTEVNGHTAATAMAGSPQNVSGNTLSAGSYGNGADNSLTVTAQTAGVAGTPLSTLTTNNQTNAGSQSAATEAVRLGVFASGATSIHNNANGIENSALSVNDNRVESLTYANNASNINSVTVANSAYLGNLETNNSQTNTSAGVGNSTLSSIIVRANAENADQIGLANSPTSVSSNEVLGSSYGNYASNLTRAVAGNALLGSGSATALLATSTQSNAAAMTSSANGVDLGAITASAATGISGSAVTVDSNKVMTSAYGNAAGNAVSASGGNTISSATALVTSNDQTNSGAIAASTSNVALGVFTGNTGNTGLVSSPTSVSANAVSALSYGNQAGNSVTATAGDVIYGASGTAPTASVSNTQSNSGNTSSSLDTVKVGLFTNNSADASTSAVTVDGNRLNAASYSNSAVNSLSLNAPAIGATGTVVTGQVSNSQSNSASGSGTISSATIGIAPSIGASDALVLNGVTGLVSNNALNAQAGGNTAINALNATAVASIAGNGTTTPNFQVLNYQSNSAAGVMTASVSNGTIGNWGSNASNYYGPSTLTVSLNSASANAYGNSASNSLNMSALTGSSNAATVAVGNSQSNAAALSATVTSTVIGVGTGQGNGTVAISGNSITANTVGNAVSNSIGVKR